jgi:hypothetical protein
MRHQALLFHHQTFGGTVGSLSSRCYAVEGPAKACRTNASNSSACLLRDAMCIDTVCDEKGLLSAVFKFPNGKDVTVPCPTGADICLNSLYTFTSCTFLSGWKNISACFFI